MATSTEELLFRIIASFESTGEQTVLNPLKEASEKIKGINEAFVQMARHPKEVAAALHRAVKEVELLEREMRKAKSLGAPPGVTYDRGEKQYLYRGMPITPNIRDALLQDYLNEMTNKIGAHIRDKVTPLVNRFHELQAKEIERRAKSSTFKDIFFGPGSGTILQKLMTGSGFGSMFMRWNALDFAMRVGAEIGGVLIGKPLEEIGKKQFGLAGLGFSPEQMQQAQTQARMSSLFSGGTMSAAKMLESLTQVGSALDVNTYGVAELSKINELAAKLAPMTKMSVEKAAELLAKIQKAFERSPEMQGLTISEQFNKIANMVFTSVSSMSMAFGPDVLQMMKHGLGMGQFRGMDLASMLGYLAVFSNVGYNAGKIGRSFSHIFGLKGEEEMIKILLAGTIGEPGGATLDLFRPGRGNEIKRKKLIAQLKPELDLGSLMKDPETLGNILKESLGKAVARGVDLRQVLPSAEWGPSQLLWLQQLVDPMAEAINKLRKIDHRASIMQESFEIAANSMENSAARFSAAAKAAAEEMSRSVLESSSPFLDYISGGMKAWTARSMVRRTFEKAKSADEIEQALGGPTLENLKKALGSDRYAAVLARGYLSRPDLVAELGQGDLAKTFEWFRKFQDSAIRGAGFPIQYDPMPRIGRLLMKGVIPEEAEYHLSAKVVDALKSKTNKELAQLGLILMGKGWVLDPNAPYVPYSEEYDYMKALRDAGKDPDAIAGLSNESSKAAKAMQFLAEVTVTAAKSVGALFNSIPSPYIPWYGWQGPPVSRRDDKNILEGFAPF
ncbi:MAG: phage tail tape measure protein [bacterium]